MSIQFEILNKHALGLISVHARALFRFPNNRLTTHASAAKDP